MIEILEKRIEKLDEDVFEKLKFAFSSPHINPREHWRDMPYLKEDLTPAICQYIGDSSFAKTLYSSVNKDVLKRVYYGIKSSRKVPKELLESLTNWENIYLFRGRWSERNPNFLDSLDVFTIKHIYKGLNKLHEDHYKRKSKGIYESSPKYPESKNIRETYHRIISSHFLKEESKIPKQGLLF